MSHDFEPEPHEKAMIDVMLKCNTTPEWVYRFNKFLIEERTTGEIIKFIDELIHQELQKARHDWLREEIVKLEGKQFAYTDLDSKRLRYEKQAYNRALQTIIDRYLLELESIAQK